MVETHEELARLSALIDLIYQGATAPSRWTQDILPATAEYIGAATCALFTPFLMPQHGGFAFIHGMSQEQMDLYVTKYQNIDIQSQTAVSKGLIFEGSVILDTDIMPREELFNTNYYKNYLAREDMSQALISVIFGPDSASLTPVAGFSFFRRLAAPSFTRHECDRVRLLLPHLSRALAVMHKLRAAELTVATSHAALDRLPGGVALFDAAGQVTFINRAARCMLEESDGLRLKALPGSISLGQILANDALANRALTVALQTALSRDVFGTDHFSDQVLVPRTSGEHAYAVQYSSLGTCKEPGVNCDAAIAFISDGARRIDINPSVLVSNYGLTPAEARVAIALLECNSAPEVADYLGTSVNTVRTQIKQIYAKLGVDTRARFVKLMMAMAR